MQHNILDAQLQTDASNIQVTFAPFNRRFGALIIDAIIIGVIVNFFEKAGLETTEGIVIYAIANIGQSLYGPVMEGFRGATLGKQWVNLVVVNKQFGKITFGQAILRNCFSFFSILLGMALGFTSAIYADSWIFEPRGNWNISYAETGMLALLAAIYIIDCLVYINDKNHRALHDIIAGTYVVVESENVGR